MAEFDPFKGSSDGQEAFRRDMSQQASRRRSEALEEEMLRKLLGEFDAMAMVKKIKFASGQRSGKPYIGFVGLLEQCPDFPLHIHVRRILQLDTLGLLDFFDAKKLGKQQWYTLFHAMEQEGDWKQPLALLFGPLPHLKGKCLLAFRKTDSRLDELTNSITVPAKDNKEPLLVCSFLDYLSYLKKRWQPY